MNIVCVLRQSPQFDVKHVVWLKKQCERFIPHERFVCYTDVPTNLYESVTLATDWPRWWAKLEAYGDSSLKGPCLFMDLDTVILKEFQFKSSTLRNSWIMRHFTRDGFRAPEQFSCGIMLTTEEFRHKVYDHFAPVALAIMEGCVYDDQVYFWNHWRNDLRRFQDEYPDVFVSYKLHYLQHGMPEDAVFVNFHGLPRPWQVKESWIPEL